ncbi:MAG: class I SAM-dependent methyltransferase [Burkholderiales bacterium]|nr:class I SAM-dependent methyltransferase [Burkholderiales bacterium]
MPTSFYARWILPPLIDLAMRNREATRFRAELVPQARGQVLEIGIGSGLNLPHYGPAVERLYGLDPSARLLALARKRSRAGEFPVEFLERSAEAIPLADRSVDTVVCTFTLCSVPDPGAALNEMRRVLRADGTLLYAEHGLAPEPAVQRWQRRLNRYWRPLSGGCNMDRKMDALIAAAGFRMSEASAGYVKGPRVLAYVFAGRAERG